MAKRDSKTVVVSISSSSNGLIRALQLIGRSLGAGDISIPGGPWLQIVCKPPRTDKAPDVEKALRRTTKAR